MGSVTIVFALVGILLVIAIALLAVGKLGQLPPPTQDRPPLDLPADDLDPADVDGVRFAVGLRGYRMDEVDEVLDRVADDLAERDARIRELEVALSSHGIAVPAPDSSTAEVADPDPATLMSLEPSSPQDA